MKVKPKKELGQHFLKDEGIAIRIVNTALDGYDCTKSLLEIGPGTGVLTKHLLDEMSSRPGMDLRLVEIDHEAAEFLRRAYPRTREILFEEDFLKADLGKMFPGAFDVVGNFPYNISSQIFFKLLDFRDRVPQIVCMLQKEVAGRLASAPGKKAYGVLSVLFQAWYDIDYLFEVGSQCFEPQPKVQSAVIRLRRNSRNALPCDEIMFKKIVKTGFNQRRKTLRNSLKPMLAAMAAGADISRFNAGDGARTGYGTLKRDGTIIGNGHGAAAEKSRSATLHDLLASPMLDLRPEQLSVEDFIKLTGSVEEIGN
ncbi:MAG: 16S rRNA (adenine(1518)-N(6)/adenine(1519)-N(6))-dimethyltransferase RsmA [Bacteroidales bacterium]|jgi:16S rRNA (adenine1518-N6/adenine1519-N6)-dimethyltransferase|nr:16S rRNA (adenine(1518)-N(6)/adenine(1519)-N(6))-dimethyltransferase RsmA [Bacteroidales bacterium]MCI2121663.1 16S rRNA (adenine(1518)-N(6)/adenine(1519)-N(6))-dimethyltransferase RsmA [Bacteroidales bacterium]MCI2144977.1 16S rRNA (adenine(1518)-N(6)/adenine(1519)-N(6))-dimethyltransferase RsmA [Bacteroidales bacterium]